MGLHQTLSPKKYSCEMEKLPQYVLVLDEPSVLILQRSVLGCVDKGVDIHCNKKIGNNITSVRKNGARSHMPIIPILVNLRMVAVSSRLTSVL